MSLAMTAQEREAFLAGTHVGVLAVNRDGLAPLALPIWYGYQPGGEVAIWTSRNSVKGRLIQEAGRFSLCAQVDKPPYKYVTAEGPVVAVDEALDVEQIIPIAARYLPAEEAKSFVTDTLTPDSVLIRMRPEKWLSTDHGKAG